MIVSVCVTVVSLLLQSLLDRMTVEVEKNMRLSSELQEGHSGKEVRLVAPLPQFFHNGDLKCPTSHANVEVGCDFE